MLCVYRRAAGAVRSANEVARSVSTMVRAISSWIANTSASVRSYRSDQSNWPSSVDVSWAEIRRRSPARRTVPSSTQAAPSSAPMARTSCGLPLSANTDVREATRSPSTPARAAISSSVMPSLRYSFSGSGLALTNGSTAMQRTPAEAITPDPGERARDAEVGEHRVAVREQDVLGLHVAMDESLAMRVVECHAHVTRDPDRLREWHPPLTLQSLAQRAVRHVRCHIVERAVGLAGVDERQDVGMGEARRDLDLPQEPLGADRSREVAPEHLDRDFAVVLLVLREVNGRHAAPTELAVNGIAVREGRGEGGVRFGHARGNMPAPRRKRE